MQLCLFMYLFIYIIYTEIPVNSLCYLRDKTIIHNDIKNDNVVIVRGSSSFCFHQCLLILAKHV